MERKRLDDGKKVCFMITLEVNDVVLYELAGLGWVSIVIACLQIRVLFVFRSLCEELTLRQYLERSPDALY